ncbi:MAG: hypothetical protein K2J39_04995 [Ruminococcus sp.]|nr:hypothetical protein [Ruminococcus sp.]
MKNEITEKINKTGRTGKIIAQIMKWISLVCACIILACTFVVGVFLPADAIKFNGTAQGRISYDGDAELTIAEDMQDININYKGAELKINFEESPEQAGDNIKNLDITATAEKFTMKQFKSKMLFLLTGAFLILSALFVISIFAVRLCRVLEECYSPFEEDVLTAIKKLGYSFLPFGLVYIVFFGFSALAILVTVFVVILLMYIFRYGAELQQEADDTV